MSMNQVKIPKTMNYQKEEFEGNNLDHLGIIAGIIIVKAIILNGLGFVWTPLYIIPSFF
jgi:hypothetical protein